MWLVLPLLHAHAVDAKSSCSEQVPTPVTAVLVCFPLTPEYKKTFYTDAAETGTLKAVSPSALQTRSPRSRLATM
jgi:hypothetical protein